MQHGRTTHGGFTWQGRTGAGRGAREGEADGGEDWGTSGRWGRAEEVSREEWGGKIRGGKRGRGRWQGQGKKGKLGHKDRNSSKEGWGTVDGEDTFPTYKLKAH